MTPFRISTAVLGSLLLTGLAGPAFAIPKDHFDMTLEQMRVLDPIGAAMKARLEISTRGMTDEDKADIEAVQKFYRQNHYGPIWTDGTELTAHLVEISAEYDLALLQADGVRVPYLRLGNRPALSQGQRVFAIGNPLGMHDSVTSGVITKIVK